MRQKFLDHSVFRPSLPPLHKPVDRLYQNRVYLDRVYFDRVYRLPFYSCYLLTCLLFWYRECCCLLFVRRVSDVQRLLRERLRRIRTSACVLRRSESICS